MNYKELYKEMLDKVGDLRIEIMEDRTQSKETLVFQGEYAPPAHLVLSRDILLFVSANIAQHLSDKILEDLSESGKLDEIISSMRHEVVDLVKDKLADSIVSMYLRDKG